MKNEINLMCNNNHESLLHWAVSLQARNARGIAQKNVVLEIR